MANKLIVNVHNRVSRDDCAFDSKPKIVHEFDVQSGDIPAAVQELIDSDQYEFDDELEQGADGAYYSSNYEGELRILIR